MSKNNEVLIGCLKFIVSCPIGLTGEREEIMRVELYKVIKGQLVLVDYGVPSQMESYAKQGFIVVNQG